jgi:hypothetical protein
MRCYIASSTNFYSDYSIMIISWETKREENKTFFFSWEKLEESLGCYFDVMHQRKHWRKNILYKVALLCQLLEEKNVTFTLKCIAS